MESHGMNMEKNKPYLEVKFTQFVYDGMACFLRQQSQKEWIPMCLLFIAKHHFNGISSSCFHHGEVPIFFARFLPLFMCQFQILRSGFCLLQIINSSSSLLNQKYESFSRIVHPSMQNFPDFFMLPNFELKFWTLCGA